MKPAFARLLKQDRRFLVPDGVRHLDVGFPSLAVHRNGLPVRLPAHHIPVIGVIRFHERNSLAVWLLMPLRRRIRRHLLRRWSKSCSRRCWLLSFLMLVHKP